MDNKRPTNSIVEPIDLVGRFYVKKATGPCQPTALACSIFIYRPAALEDLRNIK